MLWHQQKIIFFDDLFSFHNIDPNFFFWMGHKTMLWQNSLPWDQSDFKVADNGSKHDGCFNIGKSVARTDSFASKTIRAEGKTWSALNLVFRKTIRIEPETTWRLVRLLRKFSFWWNLILQHSGIVLLGVSYALGSKNLSYKLLGVLAKLRNYI